jgi:hypothetical protein
VKFKTYIFEYFHEGGWWMVEIPATSLDDAQARILKLPLAKPVGELVVKIPAGLGWIARAMCWLRSVAVRS